MDSNIKNTVLKKLYYKALETITNQRKLLRKQSDQIELLKRKLSRIEKL